MPTLRYASPVRRLTSPRRLFTPKTGLTGVRRNYVWTKSMKKRRKVSTPRGNTTRAPSVRQIVQEMSEQKKKRDRTIDAPDLHEATSTLIGADIYLSNGTGPGAPPVADPPHTLREDRCITVTGIGLKGYFKSIENPNSVNTVRCLPTTLKWYLVSTTRQDDPLEYWYQEWNRSSNASYASFSANAIGDEERWNRRINRLDIKILARGQYSVTHPNFATTNIGHYVHINKYIKTNIKIHYNVAVDTETPYNSEQVRPNVWLVMMCMNPDTQSPIDKVETDSFIKLTTYFRE